MLLTVSAFGKLTLNKQQKLKRNSRKAEQLSESYCETWLTDSDGQWCVVLSEGRGPTLQSSRSLDALSDLKLQRLEAELEGARHQAEGACQREKELRAELQRLQQEVAQLQDAQSQV